MELTLSNIAESIGDPVIGDDQVLIRGINSLLLAEKGEISFLADPRLKDQIKGTKASAVIVKELTNLYQGPQVGVSDHLEIDDRVMVGGGSGVVQSIPAGEVVSGFPTMPHRLWLKTRGHIRRLPEYSERLRELENRVKELEEQLKRE